MHPYPKSEVPSPGVAGICCQTGCKPRCIQAATVLFSRKLRGDQISQAFSFKQDLPSKGAAAGTSDIADNAAADTPHWGWSTPEPMHSRERPCCWPHCVPPALGLIASFHKSHRDSTRTCLCQCGVMMTWSLLHTVKFDSIIQDVPMSMLCMPMVAHLPARFRLCVQRCCVSSAQILWLRPWNGPSYVTMCFKPLFSCIATCSAWRNSYEAGPESSVITDW